MISLSAGQGLELFDRACDLGEAFLAPVRLDERMLRRQAMNGTLPVLLGGLIRATSRRRQRRAGAVTGSLAERLAGVEQAERERIVLELIRTHAAGVLGYASPETIEPTRVFKDLGFISLAGIELRNRLATDTGLRLPASLVFDHPTPVALLGLCSTGSVGRAGRARFCGAVAGGGGGTGCDRGDELSLSGWCAELALWSCGIS